MKTKIPTDRQVFTGQWIAKNVNRKYLSLFEDNMRRWDATYRDKETYSVHILEIQLRSARELYNRKKKLK